MKFESNSLNQCLQSQLWPGNRSRVLNARKKRKIYKYQPDLLHNLRNGPKTAFSFKYLFASYYGLIYLQIYLWLIKDMAWSQLKWFYSGMIFGSLALILSLCLVLLGIIYKAYTESLLAFGYFLWLLSNYIWMIGELWGYKITLDSPEFLIPSSFENYQDDYLGIDIFYDDCTKIAQIISILACLWLGIIIFLLPFIFYDHDSNFYSSLLSESPRYRFRFYFRDYLEYENFHLFFWALKDNFWIFNISLGYYLCLIITIITILDIIFILLTSNNSLLINDSPSSSSHDHHHHDDQKNEETEEKGDDEEDSGDIFIEIFHYYILFLWILANLFWATNELIIEKKYYNEIKDKDWDNYNLINSFKNINWKYFWGRYISGYIYILGIISLIIFYIYWIYLTIKINGKKKKKKKRKEREYGDSVAIEEEENNNNNEVMKPGLSHYELNVN